MSRSHLALAECIGIEAFVSIGMSCREIAACPASPPPHHFQQAASQPLQIRLLCPDCCLPGPKKTKDAAPWPLHEPLRSGRMDR